MSAKFSLCGLATVALIAFSTPAFAGECPADKVKADAITSGETAPLGVTDSVLAQIDLAGEAIAADRRHFRLRQLVIQPGGIVPWHSHADRPALIYVVEGEILEFSSNCTVPIVHQAGEVATETHVTAHWWKNNSNRPVTLLSADIHHDESDPSMM
jgi:quercetin dioxygenase-like cupin family protein